MKENAKLKFLPKSNMSEYDNGILKCLDKKLICLDRNEILRSLESFTIIPKQ